MVRQAVPAADDGLQAETRTAHLRLHQRGPGLRLYLDSSALAKLFLDEPGREAIATAVEDAGARATSRLAYVECGAAFARAHREGRGPREGMPRVVEAFEREWQDMAIVELDDDLARQAVTIVRDHRLRSSDAIHLASALAVAPAEDTLTFACFDRRLWEAAGGLGLERLPVSPP